jgi:hypothetical protein
VDQPPALQGEDQSQPVGTGRPRLSRPLWRVESGPVGRGPCLVADEAHGLRLLLPPGTPLELPERDGGLMQWRSAAWADGEVVEAATQLAMSEAVETAPANRRWIEAQMPPDTPQRGPASSIARAVATVQASGAPPETAPAAVLPDSRPVVSVTHSASAFSGLVFALPPDATARRVMQVANAAPSLAELHYELEILGNQAGVEATREVLIALVHARARSHSWRWTRPLRRLERRSSLHALLGEDVDEAYDGLVLANRLLETGLPLHVVDEALVATLFERTHGLRWQLTRPLRFILGDPRLARARRALRELRGKLTRLLDSRRVHRRLV